MGEIGIPRQMFLWSVAAIYMCAFASLYVQIPGLFGDDGITPVRQMMPTEKKVLLEKLRETPSLVWLAPSVGLEVQQWMELLCLLGLVLSLQAVLLHPLRDSLVFFCLWAIYMSLYQVGQTFLHCNGDRLLLDTGFVAILVAPLGLLRIRSVVKPHDHVTFWLARWLLFRLVFGMGVAKLLTGDPSWWDLSAMKHHQETQANPTPLAWYAHLLPDWLQHLGAVSVLVADIAVPLLTFFAPIRCLRLGGFYIQVILQLYLMLTGNCSLFNLLIVALSFSLLDDDAVHTWIGPKKKKKSKTWTQALISGGGLLVELGVYLLILYAAKVLFQLEINWEQKMVTSKINFTKEELVEFLGLIAVPSVWMGVLSLTWHVVAALLGSVYTKGCFSKLLGITQCVIFTAVVAGLFAVSLVPYTDVIGLPASSKILPEVRRAHGVLTNYGLSHAYGIEERWTEVDGRPEVVLEGSMDKKSWTEIKFTYNPVSVSGAPAITSPHLPRLDQHVRQASWAAHADSPWFSTLLYRLLQGKPEVVSLIQTDDAQYPFGDEPPAFVRASLYTYHFTKPTADGSQPEQWWRRQRVGEFYPTVHLGDPALEAALRSSGLKDSAVQLSSDSAVAQALELVRGQVRGRSGHLVLLSLLLTVTAILILKSLLSRRPKGPKPKSAPAEPKSKKTKESAAAQQKSGGSSGRGGKKENKEERGHDSPRKRK